MSSYLYLKLHHNNISGMLNSTNLVLAQTTDIIFNKYQVLTFTY